MIDIPGWESDGDKRLPQWHLRSGKIGLHLQQQRSGSGWVTREQRMLLQRWWRLPLENDIIKDGRIVDAQQLAKTLLPWSRELPQRHHIMLAFPRQSQYSGHFRARRCPLGEREQTAWLTMARELIIWIRLCASITAKTHQPRL